MWEKSGVYKTFCDGEDQIIAEKMGEHQVSCVKILIFG